jgi:flagellar basal-body rod protein FlgB
LLGLVGAYARLRPKGTGLADLDTLVNEITDRSILAALGRYMTTAVARQSAAASNLANIDTPGYRTRDASFTEALDGELGAQPIARTNTRHLGGAPLAGGPSEEAQGLATRRDGNNVQLDRELLALTRASGDFAAAQTALAAKFRLVRYTINEGR